MDVCGYGCGWKCLAVCMSVGVWVQGVCVCIIYMGGCEGVRVGMNGCGYALIGCKHGLVN